MAERIDEVGFGGLKLIQDSEEFCYGVDAVLLADFAAKRTKPGLAGPQMSAIDLGCGTGIIPLILSHKTPWHRIEGVELQSHSFELAQRNAVLNGLGERIYFRQGDLAQWETLLAGREASFDIVTSNPPYTRAQGGLVSPSGPKALARHETTATLEDFLACGAWLLKDGGHMLMVYRPSRLVDICAVGRAKGLELKELRPVSGRPGQRPNIVLLDLVKGGMPELRLLDTLQIYGEDGSYTEELLQIYEKQVT